MYNSLIASYLNYGLLLWGSAAKTHLNKFVVLQKKAMRIIAHAPYNAHTNDLFLRFRLLKLDDIYKTQVGTYMFKQLHSLSPEPLIRNYRRNRDVHSYNTRYGGDIQTLYARTQRAASSFLCYAPSYWSRLSQEIRECHSLRLFQRCHKKYIIQS